jgi:hypothetical protein
MNPNNDISTTPNSAENKEPITIREDNPLKQIRTFQGDVAEALRRQNESLASIQQREQARRIDTAKKEEKVVPKATPAPTNEQATPKTQTQPQQETQPRPRSSNQNGIQNTNPGRTKELALYFVGSVVLIGLSGLGGWYAYNTFMNQRVADPIPAPENRFVSPNTEKEIVISESSRLGLVNSITQNVEAIGLEEIRHLVIKEQPSSIGGPVLMSSERFLSLLESRAPGSLVRAFDPLFMLGIVGKESLRPSTFIIFKLESFENAFAGMLDWEESIAEDIGPIFSTAEILRSGASEIEFRDITTRNKDVRVLEINGQVSLLYSFYDNEILIITDNLETMQTLIERLNREKLSR